MGFLLTISSQRSITFWKGCFYILYIYIYTYTYVLMRNYYILYWEWFLCLATWWDCETGYERNGAQIPRDDPCSWRWQCSKRGLKHNFFFWFSIGIRIGWLYHNYLRFCLVILVESFFSKFLLFDVHNDICCIQVLKNSREKNIHWRNCWSKLENLYQRNCSSCPPVHGNRNRGRSLHVNRNGGRSHN